MKKYKVQESVYNLFCIGKLYSTFTNILLITQHLVVPNKYFSSILTNVKVAKSQSVNKFEGNNKYY